MKLGLRQQEEKKERAEIAWSDDRQKKPKTSHSDAADAGRSWLLVPILHFDLYQ